MAAWITGTVLGLLLSVCNLLIPVQSGLFQDVVHLKKPTQGCGTRDPKLVTVTQGTMQGSTMFSGKGRPFCSFRGIPFSQPPVGEYRFQPPRKPKPWKGVLDATRESPQCLALLPVIEVLYGQEDCLYLSVFTPTLVPYKGQLLDVIVWIFFGQYFFGTTMSFVTGPHYFMDKDVVLVFVNYRLGVLGFLSTGDDESPGNYALKDQVAALRWVKNNIATFGGNPNSVTLMGVSSGASSCHLNMLSPLSKGLFHRVISMGGTAVNPWARCPNPLEVAKKQAHIVGCPTNSTADLVSCLRETDARKLFRAIKHMFLWIFLPSHGYGPVVERKSLRNPNPFLTEDPLQLMRAGKFEHVPWLMGGNSHEAAVVVAPILTLKFTRDGLRELVENNKGPQFLMLDVSAPAHQMDELVKKILSFYIDPVYLDTNTIEPTLNSLIKALSIFLRKGYRFSSYSNFTDQFLNAISDRFLIHGQHKAAQLHSLAGNQTIYKYNFAYRGLYSASMITTLKNYGTSHGDELVYLFKIFGGLPLHPPHHPDLEVRDILLTLMTNFAKYGNPTPPFSTGNDLVDKLEWLPVEQTSLDNLHLRYLNIGQVDSPNQSSWSFGSRPGRVKMEMATDLYKRRMDFWDSLPLNENCLRDCK